MFFESIPPRSQEGQTYRVVAIVCRLLGFHEYSLGLYFFNGNMFFETISPRSQEGQIYIQTDTHTHTIEIIIR